MTASLSNEASAEPNLTPILDMVFQLITFFMLVINFKSASLDLRLKLPVVGSARPVDSKGQTELLILNIDSAGNLTLYGNPQNIDEFIAREAQASRLAVRRNTGADLKPGDDLPTKVVVRADRSTPFRLLNRVIAACQKNGYRNFAMMAMNKQD